MSDNGVWLVWHWDFSGLAIFSHDQELEARRYATENYMGVAFVPFGQDLRQYLASL